MCLHSFLFNHRFQFTKGKLMIPELGLFSLILAFCLALAQIILPLFSLYPKFQNSKTAVLQLTRPLALGQCFLIGISFSLLVYAFIYNDFSVAYVAHHSNASLPLFYRISAVWGGHEGSLLLWVAILSIWMGAVSVTSHALSEAFIARVLVVMGLLSASFLLFLLATSNPFSRLLPNYPLDGQDLNPLLQDIGLIIHPPILYLGYIGFSVPFAFAVAVLWLGELQQAWIQWIRPFILIAFSFLTLGIALGSWWAYYELGWGGWWFWDPVENASFMPWILGIALLHSVIITNKQQKFSGWTILLSLITFTFCVLGTFLVRSGILTSVHAFASDPKRGLFILQILAILIGGAFVLYTYRAKKLSSVHAAPLHLYSRESLLIFNTMLLLVAALSILLGTLFPIFYEATTGQKVSVGFPYFNTIFVPLMIPVLCSIPLGPFMRWGSNHPWDVVKQLKGAFIISIALGISLPWIFSKAGQISVGVITGLSLAFWIALGTAQRVFVKMSGKGLKGMSLGAWGMVLGHFGMAVMVVGIVIVSHYQVEREERVVLSKPIELRGYQITLKNIEPIEGSNYIGYRGHFVVEKNGQKISELFPEKRLFVVPGTSMTETAIDVSLWRDIYISLGEKLPDGGFSARIYYKPFVRWIWLGALIIAVGGFMAALHRKHKGNK
jgi:cytochrome c-type biogenesis protein CcmF